MPLTSKGGDDAPLFFAASIMPSLGFVILGKIGGVSHVFKFKQDLHIDYFGQSLCSPTK